MSSTTVKCYGGKSASRFGILPLPPYSGKYHNNNDMIEYEIVKSTAPEFVLWVRDEFGSRYLTFATFELMYAYLLENGY